MFAKKKNRGKLKKTFMGHEINLMVAKELFLLDFLLLLYNTIAIRDYSM
jgi:hypothetical protein